MDARFFNAQRYGFWMVAIRLAVIAVIAALAYCAPLDQLQALRPYIGWGALAVGLVIAFAFPRSLFRRTRR